ncbi:MAG TPA: response regulator [Chitinivibrionales bacterium]
MNNFEKKQVLVIDDDDDVRDCIVEYLIIKGFDVSACKDGFEGMRQFASQRYDLVITDIMMPGKDGLSTMIAMQKINPSVKILAISGAEMKNELLHAAGLVGAVGMLLKPFSMEELTHSIQTIINKPLAGSGE